MSEHVLTVADQGMLLVEGDDGQEPFFAYVTSFQCSCGFQGVSRVDEALLRLAVDGVAFRVAEDRAFATVFAGEHLAKTGEPTK